MKGRLTDTTFEMLDIGRKLADELDTPLKAITIGDTVADMPKEMGCADLVYVYENPQCAMMCPDIATEILKQLLAEEKDALILVAGTNLSQGIGAKLAAAMNMPLINFCTDMQVSGNVVEFTSKLFGGKILSNVHITDNKGIVNVYPGAFQAETGKSDKTPDVEKLEIALPESKITFTDYPRGELHRSYRPAS
jgi:electron transfer flavoprotein alpha subunit